MTSASDTKVDISFLKSYQAELETEFEKLFDSDWAEVSFGIDADATELIESVKYSVLDGGKRLRPILSLLVAEALVEIANGSGEDMGLDLRENPALGLALAVELVHSGSLIHDDLPCMDDDDLRRGRLSNHKKFGEAEALLAGDFLLVYPMEVLINKSRELKIDPVILNEAILKFAQAINGMIMGQSLDISLTELQACEESSSEDLEEALIVMERLKTGSLLVASVEIAAILAKANKEQIEALVSYAENLGLAFQITDDILDCTASTEELGKTSGKDSEQNKLTYVQKYGLDKSREIAKALIEEAKDKLKTSLHNPDKLNLVADYVISRTN